MLKRKIMLGTSAGLIGALAIAGAAFAQEGPADGTPRDLIKDRVAEILGIDREDLDSAMSTARDEYRDARHDTHIADLIEQGVITPEQADEIDDWHNSRPAVMDELERPGVGPGQHLGGLPHDDASVEARLAALVEQEVITQAEADAILTWRSEKPEYLDDLREEMRPERDGSHGPQGRHQHGGRGHGHGGSHGPGGFGQFGQQAHDSGTGTSFTMPDGSEINL